MSDEAKPALPESVVESVAWMTRNPGVYICGDKLHRDVTVVIASYGGALYQMKLDGELKPDRFLPTFVLRNGPHK